jgi:hypothetical protein
MRLRLFFAASLLCLGAFARAQPSAVVWSEDFERYSTAARLDGWLDPSGLFATRVEGDNVVYGVTHPAEKQRSVGRRPPGGTPDPGAMSTLSRPSFLAADGFEFRGRFRRASAASLVGLTFFSRQPELDRYHQIALWRDNDDAAPSMRLFRADAANIRLLEASSFSPDPGSWYRFLIRVDREAAGTRIRAQFWLDGDDEPRQWHLEAIDPDAAQPVGRIGLWSFAGAAHFDDLEVASKVDDGADRTAPAIRFSESGETIAGGSTALFNRDANIDVRALDGSGIASLVVTLDGTAYTPLTAIATERSHILRARATDPARNSAEAQIVVVVDKTPPVIDVSNAGASLPNHLLTRESVTPDITVTDLTEVTVEARLDGAGFTSGTTVSAEGQHALSIVATDALGWRTTREPIAFTIDRTPPAMTILSPANEARVATGAVDVHGHADDAVRVLVNGLEGIVDVPARTFRRNRVPLVEGVNAIEVTGTDGAGNEGRFAVRVQLDTRTPELSVLAPLPNACLSANEIEIRGTTRGATTIRVRTNGVAPVTATLSGIDWTARMVVPGEGDFVVLIEAVDVDGQTSSTSLPITIDRTKPEIVFTESGLPFTASLVNRSVTPFVRAIDDDPNAQLAVTLDGQPFAAGTALRADRVYVLRAVATDCAGNSAAREHTFTIDTRPPQIVSFDPPDGATVAEKRPLVGRLSEAATVVEESSGAAADVDGLTFTLAAPWVEGRNALSFVATDPAGNASRTPFTLRVRTAAPFVEIVEDGLPIPVDALFGRPVRPVIRSSDPAASFTATLNGQPFVSGSAVAADASYRLLATARDSAGNVSDETTAPMRRLQRSPSIRHPRRSPSAHRRMGRHLPARQRRFAGRSIPTQCR